MLFIQYIFLRGGKLNALYKIERAVVMLYDRDKDHNQANVNIARNMREHREKVERVTG